MIKNVTPIMIQQGWVLTHPHNDKQNHQPELRILRATYFKHQNHLKYSPLEPSQGLNPARVEKKTIRKRSTLIKEVHFLFRLFSIFHSLSSKHNIFLLNVISRFLASKCTVHSTKIFLANLIMPRSFRIIIYINTKTSCPSAKRTRPGAKRTRPSVKRTGLL